MKGTATLPSSPRPLYPFRPKISLTPRPSHDHFHLPVLTPHKEIPSFASTSRTKRTEIPTGLERYLLQRTIGVGGYARVRLAVDIRCDDPVVVKIVSKAFVVKKAHIKQMKEERRLYEKLKHPFIVEFREAFQDQYFLYLVLEYAQGGNFQRLLTEQGAFSPSSVKLYACEIYCGLAYLHSQSVLHRDLKPENLLLTALGHVKISDFSLAKETQERTYTLCGTPEYIAPEIINGEGYGLQCDWWAYGVLLYELTTGRTPFYSLFPYDLYENILTAQVEFPPSISSELRSLLQALLRKDPTQRATETQIRASSYFSGVNWAHVEKGRLVPPYRPKVSSPFDDRHFERFQEAGLAVDERKKTDSRLFEGF